MSSYIPKAAIASASFASAVLSAGVWQKYNNVEVASATDSQKNEVKNVQKITAIFLFLSCIAGAISVRNLDRSVARTAYISGVVGGLLGTRIVSAVHLKTRSIFGAYATALVSSAAIAGLATTGVEKLLSIR